MVIRRGVKKELDKKETKKELEKKETKKETKKESEKQKYDRQDAEAEKRWNELQEKNKEDLRKEKQLEVDKVKEEKRKEKIIVKYLTKLEERLTEADTYHFWVFPDRAGFKKIYSSVNNMEKMLLKNPEKFKNRSIAYFAIQLYHNCNKNSPFKKSGIWMSVSLSIFQMDDKANLHGETGNGCHWAWKTDDFKLTKFSFKLLETIMYPINDRVTSCESLMGLSITYVVDLLEKKGADFTDVLQPLANI